MVRRGGNNKPPDIKINLDLTGPTLENGVWYVLCIATLQWGNKSWSQGGNALFQVDGDFTAQVEEVDNIGQAQQKIQVFPGKEHTFRAYFENPGIWSVAKHITVPPPKKLVPARIEVRFYGSDSKREGDIFVWAKEGEPIPGAQVRIQNRFKAEDHWTLAPTDQNGCTFCEIRLAEPRTVLDLWVEGFEGIRAEETFVQDAGIEGCRFN